MTSPETLPALLNAVTAKSPAAPVLIEDGNIVSFEALEQRSCALAAGLEDRGIAEGSRVALWLPNRSDWLICLFALARLRAIAVAVNTRFRSAEVEDIVGRSRCTALIYEPGFKGIDFDAILRDVDPEALRKLTLVITARGGVREAVAAGAEHVALDDLAREAGPPNRYAEPGDGAIAFTTSGTTSKPKFVLHTHRSLSIHAREVAQAFDYVAPNTVLLQALPLCGTFGLTQALAAIAAGRPSINMTSFDAREAVHLIAEHQVTTFNGSDEMLQRICETSQPQALNTIKWCGFAAFTNARVDSFVENCARAGLKATGLYGMSEVQALYARQPLSADIAGRALAGGGLTSPDAQVQVRDPDTGEPLPRGQTGELHLKGPSRMREYMDDPEATSRGIGEDGFVRSGDLGYLLDDRRFVFETRMGDGIRLGGFLVNPAEIDAWLERHPRVAASQTVGIVIGDHMRPASFVIAADDHPANEASLIAHCCEGLAKFKVPQHIFTLEEFPATDGPNGKKIQRGRLRAMAQERLA